MLGSFPFCFLPLLGSIGYGTCLPGLGQGGERGEVDAIFPKAALVFTLSVVQ